MTLHGLEKINRWHILFDELCNSAGFHDAASLAGRYCELAGSGGQKEYEAALRNLNNWRSGRHIPRLRSLRTLEKVLEVDQDPVLLERWNALYRQANECDDDNPADPPAADKAGKSYGMPRLWRAAGVPTAWAVVGGALLFVLGIAVGHIGSSGWRPWGGPADHAPMVVYKPEIWMSVGESKVIYAERGDCGRLPRDWLFVASDLPPATLGAFSDGGLARRNSKFCRGITPARAIIFTARQAGVEEFSIQGDFFKVTVSEAG